MTKRVLIVVLVAAMSLIAVRPSSALAGCRRGDGQLAGAVMGGLVGGLVGKSLAGRRHRTLGVLTGGGLGVLIGGAIGRSLDACEKQKMAAATETALNAKESGPETVQTWTSDSRERVKGQVAAAPPETQSDGRICRNVTQVNYVDGRELTDRPRFCRTPPNSA